MKRKEKGAKRKDEKKDGMRERKQEHMKKDRMK